jgi:hypothetical protein
MGGATASRTSTFVHAVIPRDAYATFIPGHVTATGVDGTHTGGALQSVIASSRGVRVTAVSPLVWASAWDTGTGPAECDFRTVGVPAYVTAGGIHSADTGFTIEVGASHSVVSATARSVFWRTVADFGTSVVFRKLGGDMGALEIPILVAAMWFYVAHAVLAGGVSVVLDTPGFVFGVTAACPPAFALCFAELVCCANAEVVPYGVAAKRVLSAYTGFAFCVGCSRGQTRTTAVADWRLLPVRTCTIGLTTALRQVCTALVPCYRAACGVFFADAFFAAKVSTSWCSIVLAASSTGWEAAAVFVAKSGCDEVAYSVPCHGTTSGF